MQRCACDDMRVEEEEEDMSICSSSCVAARCHRKTSSLVQCSAASSILFTSKVDEDENEDEGGAGCITPKTEDHLTICSYNDSYFISSFGNVSSCVAESWSGKAIKCSGATLIISIGTEDEEEDKDDKSAGCVTPKAQEHKIPHPLACPPPPHKKLKKRKSDQIAASDPFDAGYVHIAAKPKVLSNFYECTSRNFFNPPPDLHAYPERIKALFKS